MKSIVLCIALASIGFGLAWSLGCCRAPRPTTLPEDESQIEVAGPPETGPLAQVSVPPGAPAGPGDVSTKPALPAKDAPGAETPEGTAPSHTPISTKVDYKALTLDGAKGGRIRFVVPGTVPQVQTALLDFEHMRDHRSWARTYRTLSRTPETVVAAWGFKGRLGMNPTVHVVFETIVRDTTTTIRFSLRKKALGIASLFGDYRLRTLPGTPARTEVVERTFLDSGLPFANASRADLEKGHRKDAELIRAWMQARVAASLK